MNNPFYQGDDIEDEAYDGGMAYERSHRRMTNPILTKEKNFFFLIMTGEETTQVLTNIG